MKLVCEFPANTLRVATATNNISLLAQSLKNMPGVGKPFLCFAAIDGTVAAADFDLHPDWAGHGNVVNTDVTKNAQMIQAMLDATPAPLDALTIVE